MEPLIEEMLCVKLKVTYQNAIDRLLLFLDHGEAECSKDTANFIARNFKDMQVCSDFNKVLERKEACVAICNQFDSCRITVLSEDENPDQEKLMDSATKSDLTIKVKGHRFLVHKNLLSERNRVFASQISALPLNDNASPTIDISDFKPKTVNTLLQFIYTGKVKKEDISQELMEAAHKYESQLQKTCEDKLVSTVYAENAIELLMLSVKVESEKLKEETTKFIVDQYSEMEERAEFQIVEDNPAAMMAILRQMNEQLKAQRSATGFVGTFKLRVPLRPCEATAGRFCSEPFYLKNVPWIVMAELKADNLTNLGVYLQCNDRNVYSQYNVTWQLKLTSSVDKKHNVTHGKLKHTFLPGENRGFNNFVSYTDLKDEEKGLMLNDTVTVEVDARVE